MMITCSHTHQAMHDQHPYCVDCGQSLIASKLTQTLPRLVLMDGQPEAAMLAATHTETRECLIVCGEDHMRAWTLRRIGDLTWARTPVAVARYTGPRKWFRHYKGGAYRVLGHTEHDGEMHVIYQSPHTRIVWVRPASMFHQRLADGRLRFAPLN